MGSTCYWCWRCMGVVDPYRTWIGDGQRCPQCHRRVQELSLGTLRFFSFLGEGVTPEERLRRARQGSGAGRQGAYHAEAGPSGWRSRHEWRFDWGAAGQRNHAGAGRGDWTHRASRRSRSMTRGEALDLLGLDDLAGEPEVRAAYRRLAKRHHPDVQATPELRIEAHRMMARLNAAYRCLMPER